MPLIPNTFGLSCSFDDVCDIESPFAHGAIQRAQRDGRGVVVLGAGSNILLTAERLDALIVRANGRKITYQHSPDAEGSVLVRADAGAVWHELVLETLRHSAYGLENLSFIPGTVGAAPVQNIGAYGVEVAEFIDQVFATDLITGEPQCFSSEQCQFGYRDSIFKRQNKNRYCITSVQLRLSTRPQLRSTYETLADQLKGRDISSLTPFDISDAVINVRRSRLPDPAKLGNAGSFFKNPLVTRERFDVLRDEFPDLPHYRQTDGTIKLAAGWLIEKCGLKGVCRGRAGTHDKQALVIVNLGGARGEDILAMAREVKTTVAERFAITLEHEVRILDRNGGDVVL